MNMELSSSALILMMLSWLRITQQLKKTVPLLKTKVSLKDVRSLSKYVGCTIVTSPQTKAVDVATRFDYKGGRDIQATH
jgi:hypothetical protein